MKLNHCVLIMHPLQQKEEEKWREISIDRNYFLLIKEKYPSIAPLAK